METITIREVIEQVGRGQIRIPAFQRGFVWEPDRVAFFIDSIYKKYPFGSLLFWRAKERLRFERKLGPFEIVDPKDDYPVDYVLDGQQRITSLYATFIQTMPATSEIEWKEIYFDYTLPLNAQEPHFFALSSGEVDTTKHFPMRVLFDSASYRRSTTSFGEEIVKKIDDMQAVFKEAKIPVQIFRTEERATVATIFERINRQGVALNTFQLLSAWTWSDNFQLQQEFEDLSEELEDYGFKEGSAEENLLLRCCSAVITGDADPEALIAKTGDSIRAGFSKFKNGIRGALDFLRQNLKVQSVENIPFQTIVVPLSVFFASIDGEEVQISDPQRDCILKWFWRTCFSRRYSSGVLRNLKEDIDKMALLKSNGASTLGNFQCNISKEFFLDNAFSVSTVNSKTFILLIAQAQPISFISGTPLDLSQKLKDYNRTEFHHLMPKDFLKSRGITARINSLANLAFLSRAENRKLGGTAPSLYKDKLPPDKIDTILEKALCPISLFQDNFNPFLAERAERLFNQAKIKIGA